MKSTHFHQQTIREISIDELDVIGQGGVGTIYRINDDQILKLYTPDITLDEVREKKRTSREALLHGVPTMISFEIVRASDRYGIIFELLPSDTVGAAVMTHPDRIEEYGRKMGMLLKTLHMIRMPLHTLPRFCEQVSAWIDIMERDYHARSRSVRAMREFLDSFPDADRPLHCDFHEGNVMLQNGELILIDIDDICTGNPIFDLAFCYGNHDMLAISKNLLKQSTGLDPQMARRMRHLAMAEYFGADYEEKRRQMDSLFFLTALFTFAVSPARVGESPYMTTFFLKLILYIIHPVFTLLWNTRRRHYEKLIKDLLPEDLGL